MLAKTLHLIAALALLVLVGAHLSAGAPQPAKQDNDDQKALVKLPPLFDFGNFKRQFERSYSGLLEELARQKYYYSRALRAFVTGVKYKYRQVSYYLAVNFMSDKSPQELDRMRNKDLMEFSRSMLNATARTPAAAATATVQKLPEFLPGAGENVEQELRQLVEEKLLPTSSASHARRKRSAPAKVRELPLDRLINTGEEVQLPVETSRKIKARLPRDQMNPNYKQIELQSFGLIDQQEPLEWWNVMPATEVMQSQQMQSSSVAEKVLEELDLMDIDSGNAEPEVVVPEDEVFLDLRSTNCFFLPRSQGDCGSCYAFAMITVMEWVHCMRYGQLVAFSEQYMVDCSRAGNNYRVRMPNGCDGGNPQSVGNFVNNFGLELRANYPYRKREQVCPYGPETDLKTTGALRTEFKYATEVEYSLFPEQLRSGPMWVGISLADGFLEYAGGVHGDGCHQTEGEHAVVLIGHGREDGREYWLIRNSHSVGWGEGGYYKLAKDANCLHPKVGFKYGTKSGDVFEYEHVTNLQRDMRLMEQHYATTSM